MVGGRNHIPVSVNLAGVGEASRTCYTGFEQLAPAVTASPAKQKHCQHLSYHL